MNKFKLTLVALSCAAFLTACSSSSGGADNSEQIRQTETTLTKKLVELNQQVQSAQKKAENAQNNYSSAKTQSEAAQAEVVTLNAKVAELTKTLAELNTKLAETRSAQLNLEKQSLENQNSLQNLAVNKADADKQNAEYQKKIKELDEQAKKVAEELNNSKQKLEEAQKEANTANKAIEELNKKAAEEQKTREETEKRLRELENLSADEKARIPVSDQIFGGRTGVMADLISGAVFSDSRSENSTIGRPLAHDISELSVVDGDQIINFRFIIKKAGDLDPELYEPYDDPYNLRKSGQTIQSNSNFKSTAFGVQVDNYTGKQYLYVQGNPTDVKQIPMAGKAEYLGGAVYQKEGANNERSEMKATADFDTKTVAITINKNRTAVPEMNFGGKITGNSFAGEVNGIKTQGGFFGENAKELSGVFTNEADKARGVFGAIKQEAAAQ